MRSLIITDLYIYPIKSLGGIRLDKAEVHPKGFKHDRRMMLVDEKGTCLTQRDFPPLSLFKTEYAPYGDGFTVTFLGENIFISPAPAGATMDAVIWDDRVEVQEVDGAVSQWFSSKLGIACWLVAFAENSPRPVDTDYTINGNEQVSLADGYPILMLGQSSLDDLNSRLPDPVPMDRFRPNIVFAGGQPFEEDKMKRFSIGNVKLAGVKPCARCTLTTIDQQTGSAGKEPLATLSQYRKVGNKVLFGQNVIPLENGVVGVGDEIFTTVEK